MKKNIYNFRIVDDLGHIVYVKNNLSDDKIVDSDPAISNGIFYVVSNLENVPVTSTKIIVYK